MLKRFPVLAGVAVLMLLSAQAVAQEAQPAQTPDNATIDSTAVAPDQVACRNFHPQNASMGRVWSGFQRVSSGCQSVKVGNRNERV